MAFPVFDLSALLPGGSAQGALNNCAGVTAIGVSCSPLITVGSSSFISPLVLTNRGVYTDVSLGLTLLGRDATGSATWAGGLTTQVLGFTPSSIQTQLNSGGRSTPPTRRPSSRGAASPRRRSPRRGRCSAPG